MAKNKKGAGPRFKGQRFPRRKGALFGSPSEEYSGNNSSSASRGFTHAHGYTLAEEARNTAYNRRGAFGRDAKLRYKPVTFISAGLMDPLKDLNVQLTAENKDQAAEPSTGQSSAPAIIPILEVFPSEGHISHSFSDEEIPRDDARSASESLTQGLPDQTSAHRSRDLSNSESDHGGESSDEVILFKGRDRSRQLQASTKSKQADIKPDSLKLHELDLQLRVVEETLHQETPKPYNSTETSEYISLGSKPRQRGKQRKVRRTAASDEEAAIIADYMANIQDWEEDDDEEAEHIGVGSHAFSVLRDLGGTDSDAIPGEVSSEDSSGHDSADETDEETHQRRIEVEDERIARILAKQEELGIGGDDIVLFDGQVSDDGSLERPKAPRRKRKGDSKTAKIIQKKGQYPSATQMANAFDELDLMDWHRPSLNNFNRKNGPPAFDISDSELEEAMKSTWQKDRLKKAEKKKAREELRSQGLLGKNANPDDIRIKYAGGMSLDDLANELEAFLLGSQEQMILPPFDKSTRKTIHTLANKFKLKSQSAGKGKDRYPVLYRSKATLPFDQVIFDRTFGRIKQTWFPRVDVDDDIVNQTRILKRAEAKSGKSRFKSSLTYRDGDIVGQHATEIGTENRGRAMLEKMGWSKGMALGTGENKGIMVPITHVVKKSKAGLGDA
ncbi:hypothetical protein F5Y04DRAFT_255615 [Hypomontagnella monticulosa]|nr:hypothetical protein F5Y04DRAFT_255615 [Hypomontagnella monticulosa]